MNHLGNPWTYHFYGSVLIDEDLEIDGVLYGNHIEAESIQAKTDDISISSRNNNASLLVSDTGYVSINNEYDLPIADGTANQFLKTDGLGNTSFATITPSIISDFKLSELTDVVISNIQPNNFLTYNGTNWVNKSFPLIVDEYGNLDMAGANIIWVNYLNNILVSSIITTATFNDTFDTRFANKTTDNLTEGKTNLYYTTARANTDFDTRLATKSTTNLAEGTNLYYTTARANTDFDTRLATKSTTNLAEGTNLYYTTARANTDFDTRLATKSTTNLAEGTNLYYTTARANTDFDTRFGTKSTTDLKEGTNLYYTTARFDTQLATKTTTNLAEGANLYYTTARANTDFDTRLTTKTTDNLTEGKTNLYYTTARFDTQLATKTTTNLAEGTNLYYTTARANADFDTRLATKSTSNLAEGTNLYYTTARANADFDTRLGTKSTTNLAEGTNLYYTNARFDTQLATKSTTNLAEGTNLYYTTARANTDFDTRIGTKSIDALSDVVITTPANGQLLSYNGANWVNSTGSATYLPLTGGTMEGDIKMGTTAFTTYQAPKNMTNNNSGGYVASASSEYYPAYYAFSASSTDFWTNVLGSPPYYNDTTGVYQRNPPTQTILSGTTYNGEWIKIDLGTTYKINSYYVRPGVDFARTPPGTWRMGVSTDNTTFTLWDTRTETWTSQTVKQYTPASTTARYIIMIVSSIGSSGVVYRSQVILESLYFDFETLNYNITNVQNLSAVSLTATGITASGLITANGGITGTTLTASGLITANGGITASGLITANGGITGTTITASGLITANGGITGTTITASGLITANGGITGTTLTASGLITANNDIVVSAGKKIFIDRSALANNKLVLWDGGTPSTTAFLGFGVANATLMYNVNIAADSHVFYYGATNELFRINNTAITASKPLTANGLITANNDIVVSAGKKIFIDRAATANNKIVLYDNNTPSTTAFYGFGIAGGVLIYNVGSSGDNHIFYYGATTALTTINAGGLYVPSATAWTSAQIGVRPTATNQSMLMLRSELNQNYRGVICYDATYMYIYGTTNSNSNPSGAYNYLSNGGSIAYSSDRRLKADIQTLDCHDCCEKLMKLNCCSYYWKSDEKKEKKNHGFIADEVKKVFPEFVSVSGMKVGEDENLEGITYQDFIPILVSGFQHLAEKVSNLEKENKTLLNIIQELRVAVFPNVQQ